MTAAADPDRAAVPWPVARLSSPYREAVTLVELEGLTAKAAAALAGISVSGMKSRVQRGRAQLRALFEECCDIAVDARGKVVDVVPRPCGCRSQATRSRRSAGARRGRGPGPGPGRCRR
jgi:hypothetical protein